ncbi:MULTISPECIES: hypothetical protein [Saliphagus]|uniref:Uncharacterized protein n=1 Tax=Saliphagus infecundisoli TaxID=1849069 RepID=A0ABD5QK66_9EURY|nr:MULTISPECIES: hypothetical protein [Saliphagus]
MSIPSLTRPSLSTAQRLVGLACALAFFGLAYRSLAPEYALGWPTIAGAVVVIAILLGKLDQLAAVVDAWR